MELKIPMLTINNYNDKIQAITDTLNQFEEDIYEWDTQYIDGEEDFDIYDKIVYAQNHISDIKAHLKVISDIVEDILINRKREKWLNSHKTI